MNPMEDVIRKITAPRIMEGDYYAEDGLLYCGKCHTPKQIRLPEENDFGGCTVSMLCRCRLEELDRQEREREQRRHGERVSFLRKDCFSDPAMRRWTFANDNGTCRQLRHAKRYADQFEKLEQKNIGLLLWGAVGTGKSYFAGCIANALIEREIPVRMTNFSAILNDLFAKTEGRNEYIETLCKSRLLILDDFGMERGTEYSLEQIYSVIDARYRSEKPLIVTTNLTLTQLRDPEDTAHKRIYDRVLEMCVPIRFDGESLRRRTAEEKMKSIRELLDAPEAQ